MQHNGVERVQSESVFSSKESVSSLPAMHTVHYAAHNLPTSCCLSSSLCMFVMTEDDRKCIGFNRIKWVWNQCCGNSRNNCTLIRTGAMCPVWKPPKNTTYQLKVAMMTVVLHQEPVRISNTHRRVQILLFQQSLAHTHRFHWILLMHPTHTHTCTNVTLEHKTSHK